MVADVIQLPKKHAGGRPSRADDLQLEIDSRTVEERRFARDAAPLLRRLAFAAVELGPTTLATVNHLSYLHERHLRRWSAEDPESAA